MFNDAVRWKENVEFTSVQQQSDKEFGESWRKIRKASLSQHPERKKLKLFALFKQLLDQKYFAAALRG